MEKMSVVIWIVIGLALLLGIANGTGRNRTGGGPHRIDRPHVIDPDDYECSVCHRRTKRKTGVCPFCGARFTGSVVDEEEFIFEEDELESWDEEEEDDY